MPLTPGSRVGSYEITSPLGAGGMGEVYRARDTQLGRDVAIKIVSDVLAGDPDRRARFQREAQLLASLNHPNIAQVYGIEQSNGRPALVMELVEGPTLAERIAAGSIPVDEALAIASQMVDALDDAHARGIVHRDLKPANVKVRDDGAVKVLDFGLAKALEPSGISAADAASSPTMSLHATEAGIILGTAAYMAPEQARGRAADRRADIWAFGVVLFEMLAGRRPFDSAETPDTLASILKSEPAWEALPADLSPALLRLLRRCLQKDVRHRLQHIGDARLEIEDAQRLPRETAREPAGAKRRERVLWTLGLLGAGIAGAAAGALWLASPEPPPAEMRVQISTPSTVSRTSFAISPNGQSIVYSGTSGSQEVLWLRNLQTGATVPLPGTEGGELPFWAPDSRAIGFFADNKLKLLDIDGGEPRTRATVITAAGGSWNADGTILYVPSDLGGVMRIPADGGEPARVTGHGRFPHFLPDGRRFLYYNFRTDGPEPAGVFVGTLDSGTASRLTAADGPAVYAAGRLLFVRQGALLSQRFDPETLELSGETTQLAEEVASGSASRLGVSVSAAGTIAYRTETAARRQLAWFDRTGKPLGPAGDERLVVSNPSVSPDGRHIVVQALFQRNTDVYVIDIERNLTDRITTHPDLDALPIWSPDGRRIIFNHRGLQLKRLDGTGPDEPLRLPPARVRIACDWSPDGRYVLYKELDEATGTYDLLAWLLDGSEAPRPVGRTPHNERDGQFRPPDGKWIAYQSDELGQPEIFLQPFPGPGPKIRVSPNGGTQVRWRGDGKELFYVDPGKRLLAVATSEGQNGQLRPERPVALFETQVLTPPAIFRQQYDVTRDGQRFVIVSGEELAVSPINLILNWTPGDRP